MYIGGNNHLILMQEVSENPSPVPGWKGTGTVVFEGQPAAAGPATAFSRFTFSAPARLLRTFGAREVEAEEGSPWVKSPFWVVVKVD